MGGSLVALPKIGLNEGSLFRRTILHVGTFLIGTVAFIGLVSFVLVAIAKGLVAPPKAAGVEVADDEPEASATPGARPAKAPLVKAPGRGKRPAPATPAQPAAKDE